MATKQQQFRLNDFDRACIASIRLQEGFNSDTTAVRWALKRCSGLGSELEAKKKPKKRTRGVLTS